MSGPSRPFAEGTLPGNLLRFGEALRTAGLPATPARLIEAARASGTLDLGDPGDLYWALRALLVDRPGDFPAFDRLFQQFWLSGPAPLPVATMPDEDAERTAPPAGGAFQITRPTDDAAAEAGESLTIPVYSPDENLAERDFATLDPAEADRLAHLITQIAKRLTTRPSRRRRAAPRGREIDLRRTIRINFKYGGLPVELARRRKRRRRGPIVVLCDVSRSMAVYSRFLLQFVYGLQNSPGKVESFVFSTRIHRVTDLFRARDTMAAYAAIRAYSREWAGGTRIGASLADFAHDYGPRLLNRRTVVIILSDGLDTGDLVQLDAALADLRWRAGQIMWLNPLAGDVRYEPLAGGMRTALPYLDVFAPAHNLASLSALRDQLAGFAA